MTLAGQYTDIVPRAAGMNALPDPGVHPFMVAWTWCLGGRWLPYFSDGLTWQPMSGAGPPGAAATVAVGSTTTLAAGSPATVTNSGSSSAAMLQFGIPKGGDGSPGLPGSPGAAATVTAGTTTTGVAGSSATVTNSGSSSAAVFDFVVPRGDVGPAGPTTIGSPNTLTPAFGTVYQATNTAKPSWVSAMIDTAYTVTVASTLADTVELRIGSSSTGLAAGSSGTAVATFRSSLTGIALVIGLGLGQRNQLGAMLPTGWFWVLRRIAGTTATIASATDQSLG